LIVSTGVVSSILKPNNNRPYFCLEVWGTDYNKIKDMCILAEKLGYDGFFYGESLADIDLDCWTILSNLSAVTDKIKLGPVITYLFPQYRNIVLLAKQAVTLQETSNGRLEFRTGAGATLQWSLQWWHPYGIEYPNNVERVSMLEEGIQLLHRLWKSSSHSNNEHSVHFTGKYFKLNGASLKKPCKTIPITIAAKKRKTMQIAAKYADVWESSYITPEQFTSLSKKFEDIKSEQSNNNNSVDKKTIKKSIELDVVIADSDSDLEYKKRVFAMERGPEVTHQILNHGLVGTADKIAERMKEYIDAGVNQFFLAFQDPFDSRALELFTDACRKV
jgi:alkanesulfonate monooxygenase SsuD/methylene tetrahydromethanopterin reductase-like flavin-dependent oxidoreductase (luciferase family)